MKRLIIALTLAAASMPVMADQYVQGYIRSDGTYVQPYYRSSPNSTKADNYSTQGNYNPHTGQRGTESPYPTYAVPPSPYDRNYGYR